MNRTLIYARVSTEDQAEKYGLSSQIRACQEFAKGRLDVIGTITDDGISGVILDRPGLDKVRSMVRAGEVDTVLMFDADRLSRELAHLLILKPEIEKKARLEFVAAKFEDSPSGRLFFGIRGVIAQYEREQTRERTMRGKRERARSGLIVGGRVAYGYLYSIGVLSEDTGRAHTVRRIFALYDSGCSIRAIASRLREDGVPTYTGRKWGKSSVSRILQNETYAGVAHYGTHRRAGGNVRVLATSERIPVTVPALISREQWQRVQTRMGENAQVGRPTTTLLLRGILHCGACGRRMHGETGRKGKSYRCAGRDRLRTLAEPCTIHASAPAIDSAAWAAIRRIFTDAEYLRGLLRSREESLKAFDPAALDELRKRALKLKRKEETILSLMLDPDLTDRRSELKREYRAAADECRQVEAEIAAIEKANQAGRTSAEWLVAQLAEIREFVADLRDAALRQEFVRGLLQKAELIGDEIRMVLFIAAKSATTSTHCDQLPDGIQVVVTARVAA
jgi:site-specific DNA recombinase